jgi:acyl-CoA synthetase (AMP-forming)/AMP-acid ligase II
MARNAFPDRKAPTFDQLLRGQLAARGGKIALSFNGASATYAELCTRASQVANGLAMGGVSPGDRVAYLGKNTLAYFEYFLGAMKARAVTVPINWRLAKPELKYVIDNARPRYLLVESQFAELAESAAPDAKRLILGEASHEYESWRDRQSTDEPEPIRDPDTPLLQLYTSGTTGHPKGAILTHRSLFGLRASTEVEYPWFRWSPQDQSLIAMPVAHISGTGWAIWTLQHGATGIIAREFDPHTVFDLIVDNRINKIMMVPTALKIAVEHARGRKTDLSFLSYIYYGGAPLSMDLLRECQTVFRCGFVQMYGMTETSGTIVALSPEDHDSTDGNRLRSVGKPLRGVEVKIIDAGGHDLPIGMTGEIATRSQANMAGYFEMPTATAEALDVDGWFRTGDAGYLDAGGFLYVNDRIKDMIISGGENIYPTEVENAICGHPDVAEVAVIGIPDEKWGETVCAVVVPKPGVSLHTVDIVSWAAERIARYKLPKSIEIVSSLPRNHTGKVLRRELRDRYRSK